MAWRLAQVTNMEDNHIEYPDGLWLPPKPDNRYGSIPDLPDEEPAERTAGRGSGCFSDRNTLEFRSQGLPGACTG